MSSLNQTTNVAILSLAIGQLSPWAILGGAILGIITAGAARSKPRELTPAEQARIDRMRQIEAMPGFGLTGVGLPWPVFEEYKRLQRAVSQIVLY